MSYQTLHKSQSVHNYANNIQYDLTMYFPYTNLILYRTIDDITPCPLILMRKKNNWLSAI